ncbi:RING-H2 finger protein ATL5-like [Abrus precatorius]|uniref:RING-H2 finger protein ATL5-like n=1 Tax=Abrus precatorius TaxID=3816 RepID=A0A8B8LD90_ABRPR|nr:RING-H2 finger protein ATL5-like [Abrus precatorius]
MIMDPDVESKYAHNAKVMVGTAILLFIIILLIVFLHAYLRFCRRRRRRLPSPSLPTNSSFNHPSLHPSVLKSLPTFTFSAATHRALHDCAVCLSEFADGDEGRVLPNCNHAFHSHCIDTWFVSHSNCPLCRTLVQPATACSGAEPGSVSVLEAGEGSCSSSLPAPIGCPRKPLHIIVEQPEVERESDPVTGDQGLRWSLKRFCSV